MTTPQHPRWSDGSTILIGQRVRTIDGKTGYIVTLPGWEMAEVEMQNGQWLHRLISELTRVPSWREQYAEEIKSAQSHVLSCEDDGREANPWAMALVAVVKETDDTGP